MSNLTLRTMVLAMPSWQSMSWMQKLLLMKRQVDDDYDDDDDDDDELNSIANLDVDDDAASKVLFHVHVADCYCLVLGRNALVASSRCTAPSECSGSCWWGRSWCFFGSLCLMLMSIYAVINFSYRCQPWCCWIWRWWGWCWQDAQCRCKDYNIWSRCCSLTQQLWRWSSPRYWGRWWPRGSCDLWWCGTCC